MVYQETFSRELNFKNETRSEQPQISFRAKVRKDTFISDIFLGLSAIFTRQGAIKIDVNDVEVFSSQTVGAFRQYQTFPIGTNNKVLRNGELVKVWAWSLDGSTQTVTVSFSCGEEKFEAGKSPDGVSQLEVARLLSSNPNISSDTTAITDGLQAVRDAFGDLIEFPDDGLTLNSTRADIMLVIADAEGDYQAALQNIINALNEAESRFNQTNLDILIEEITIAIPIVRNENEELATSLTASLNTLNQIHQTTPSLRSSDERGLFPYRVYDNEYHTALLDLDGSKGMIIVVSTGAVENPTAFFTEDPASPFIPAGTATPSMTWSNGINILRGYDFLTDEDREFLPIFEVPQDIVVRTMQCRIALGNRRYRDRTITEGFQREDTFFIVNGSQISGLGHGSNQNITTFSPKAEDLGDGRTISGRERYWAFQHRIRWRPFRRIVTTREFRYNIPSGLTTTSCGTENQSFNHGQLPIDPITLQLVQTADLTDTFMELSGQIRDSQGRWHNYITPQEITRRPDGRISNTDQSVIEFSEFLNGKLLPSTSSLFRLRFRVVGRVRAGIDIVRVA